MAKRPNILILMTDQQRGDCLSCAGHPTVQTPNMDRLAAEGVRFTRFTTSSPVCMPARSTFASGLYCHNHGQWANYGCLPETTDTYMKRLRDTGYRTCHIGKSHLYPHKGEHLSDRLPYMHALGFQDVRENTGPWATVKTDSIMTDHWRALGICERFRADYKKRREAGSVDAVWPSPMPEGETIDDFVGRTAVDYLGAYDRDEPFCVFVGFGGPHEPWDPPASWAEKYDGTQPAAPLPAPESPGWLSPEARAYEADITGKVQASPERARTIQQLYFAKISHVDAWFGRIFETLEQRGVLDDTLILFWSDHGERLCDRGGLFKSVFYEEAARVPFILRTPDRTNAGQTADGLCGTADAFPTLLAAAGCEPAPSFGRPLLEAAQDPGAAIHDAVLSEIEWGGRQFTLIRDETHKLVVDGDGNAVQLFDMEADPQERTNLAGREDTEAVEARLRDHLLRLRLATDRTQKD